MKQKMPYSELQVTSRVGHIKMMASDSHSELHLQSHQTITTDVC